ncbi:MAG: EAL domain-containing protein [Desulfoarculaceae bacterium]|nr:EAL domain-containing protein [Desulfoarculaceae bacterium]
MSLVKQLWIAIAVIMALAFGGSFVVSTLSAQKYLTQQLYLKNTDNASSLAISMSQMADDPVTLELLVSAQFDSGHYQFIRLTDPNGKILLDRSNPAIPAGAPEWLQRLFPLQALPGIAQVQDGWRQLGTLTLQSHSKFAYEALWQGVLRLLFWFAATAVLAGLIGSLVLKTIIQPLHDVVDQAQAIGARRFLTIPVPRTLELHRVVSAMNSLSLRIKNMLEEESARLENLRRQTDHDSLTGLLQREPFFKHIESLLGRDDASAAGILVIARFAHLNEINRELGRTTADQFLRRIGEKFSAITDKHPDWLAGRLNGSDFAVLVPGGVGSALDLAQEIAGALHLAIDDANLAGERLLPVGATSLDPGEPLSQLLIRTDSALAAAEGNDSGAVQVVNKSDVAQPFLDLTSWRAALTEALDSNALQLGKYPVVDSFGKLLHFEAPVRLLIAGEWLSAGIFMPWAARLGLMPCLDGSVVTAALQELRGQEEALGINISAEALCDAAFLAGMIKQLQQSPELAARLWIEVPESGAFRHLAEFRDLCLAVKPFGTKIGLEHVGHQFSRIGELHDLGLDYIKIDAAIIRDIQANSGSQAFLRGLCVIAHSIGLTTIAEGVQSQEELEVLPGFGVDGMTGPGIRS